MRAFLDTSVLVASFYHHHRHHQASREVLLRQRRATGSTAAHCLAEFYSVVTGFPGKDRARPEEAFLVLDGLQDRLSLSRLEAEEYLAVIDEAARQGISGGGIYDAVIARCALKIRAKTIYTWNTRHFERLGAEVAALVREP
jgi:predicted nucleic acid-binding protein